MNITFSIKSFLPALLICWLLPFNIFAGNSDSTETDTTFSFSVDLAAGATANQNDLNDLHFSPSLGLFWNPNHLLSIGVEVSYIRIKESRQRNVESEFGTTDFHGTLKGYPILLVFSMPVTYVNVYGGVGLANVESGVDAFDKKVTTSYWYYCYYFSTGYQYKLSDRLNTGIRFRLYSFPKLEQTVLGLTIQLEFTALQW